jgi:hypothetical protein
MIKMKLTKSAKLNVENLIPDTGSTEIPVKRE